MAYKNLSSPSEREHTISIIERLFGAKYDSDGKVIVPPHHEGGIK